MNPIDTERLQDWAIGMAKHVAKLSKDPSTQVGAVIFDPKRRLVSAGYNGFARGVKDTPERLQDRDTKYKLILHAEKNAIMFATAPLEGCTLVVTHPCCAQCAALVIQSGIAHVMWPRPTAEFRSRWEEEYKLSKQQFAEAGVQVEEV
jgi:dCMP deaminase